MRKATRPAHPPQKPKKRNNTISVKIPEKLFFDIVDLLREPKMLTPLAEECVLLLDDRNTVLNKLLTIRRQLVRNAGRSLISPPPPPPAERPHHDRNEMTADGSPKVFASADREPSPSRRAALRPDGNALLARHRIQNLTSTLKSLTPSPSPAMVRYFDNLLI